MNDLIAYVRELKKSKKTYDRIIDWKEFAEMEPNRMKKFIFRWISFNGFYSAFYRLSKRQECNDDLKKVKHLCKFIINDKKIWSRIYSDRLKDIFLINISDIENKTMNGSLQTLKSSASKGIKARCLILVAYRIRCRLFHGQKNTDLDLDERVVKTADDVIKPILEYITKII